MASGLEKAKRLVSEKLASGAHINGVAVTLYRDATQYAFHHPGENFAQHQQQRAEFVAWLGELGIDAIDASVPGAAPLSRTDLAERAVLSVSGPAIGAKIGIVNDPHQGYVGWALMAPKRIEKGEL